MNSTRSEIDLDYFNWIM